MTVLVAFASKHGSTEEIAQAIADRLRELGEPVDVGSVDKVGDLGDSGRSCSGALSTRGLG